MKKAALLASLTCVVAALCVSYLTLSSHWSVISKVILLMLSSFVCSSAALLAILGWLDTLSTTSSRAGLNRLALLKAAESRIARGETKTSKDFSEDHGLWCDGYCCMNNPKNLYYKER